MWNVCTQYKSNETDEYLKWFPNGERVPHMSDMN